MLGVWLLTHCAAIRCYLSLRKIGCISLATESTQYKLVAALMSVH